MSPRCDGCGEFAVREVLTREGQPMGVFVCVIGAREFGRHTRAIPTAAPLEERGATVAGAAKGSRPRLRRSTSPAATG